MFSNHVFHTRRVGCSLMAEVIKSCVKCEKCLPQGLASWGGVSSALSRKSYKSSWTVTFHCQRREARYSSKSHRRERHGISALHLQRVAEASPPPSSSCDTRTAQALAAPPAPQSILCWHLRDLVITWGVTQLFFSTFNGPAVLTAVTSALEILNL